MLHHVSGRMPDTIDRRAAPGRSHSHWPVRGQLVAESITKENMGAAVTILYQCFRDKISKREIDQCLEAYLSGDSFVPGNAGMNVGGFHILEMFIFRNNIRQAVAVGGLRKADGRPERDISLLWISVDPRHRRKGYGLAMLRALEEIAIKKYDAAMISLSTDYEWEGSAPARAMYERYGFRVESTYPIFWGKEELLQAWYKKKAEITPAAAA